ILADLNRTFFIFSAIQFCCIDCHLTVGFRSSQFLSLSECITVPRLPVDCDADGVERGDVSYGTVGMDCVCHALIFRPSDGFEVLDSFGSEEFLLMHIAEIEYIVHEERTANVSIRQIGIATNRESEKKRTDKH